jgi:hypothetical protein
MESPETKSPIPASLPLSENNMAKLLCSIPQQTPNKQRQQKMNKEKNLRFDPPLTARYHPLFFQNNKRTLKTRHFS